MRMPICRSSRIACCTAAIETGRPIEIGKSTPGKSTVSRTGRMRSVSSSARGAGAPSPDCGPAEGASLGLGLSMVPLLIRTGFFAG